MKTRSFAAAVIAVLLLNFVGLAAVDDRSVAKKRQVNRLVTLLPASEGVAVFEAKRFLNDALPKILAANQPMLADIMSKINEVETRTGIDLRKFDQVAVGVAYKQISAKGIDYEPVAIASGDINAGALVAVAKLASKGTYREEKIGDHTVYVFTAKDVIQKTSAKTNSSAVTGVIDDALKGMTKEIAVASIDKNTLVIGSLARVRETLLGQSHVPSDVTALLAQRETAIGTFAMRTPGGMSNILPLDNDELGVNLDSITYLSGAVDVTAAGTSLQMAAKTKQPEQAQNLKDTLEGLQIVGKAIFGGSKRLDQQVYGRMLKNAKFDIHGNEVTFDLLVPQADIDVLVAGLK